MKSNLILKGLAVFAVVVVVVVLAKGKKTSDTEYQADTGTIDLSSVESGPGEEDNGLDDGFMTDDFLEDDYAVDVDSPVETMRTLTKESVAVREESMKVQEKTKELQQKTSQLLKMEEALNSRVESKFNKVNKDANNRIRIAEESGNKTKKMLEEVQRQLNELKSLSGKGKKGKQTAGGYQIDASGIPEGLGYDENGDSIDYDDIVWTQPVDGTRDSKNPGKINLPDFSGNEAIQDLAGGKNPIRSDKKRKEDRLIKTYTIPDNATLLGSVTMTAMLGRIPTGGQVIDPYPFKIIVGEENLSSNAIRIPGVVGIKMSGIAKGDWTLSCVSGEISSMTFTFQDGTIVSIPEDGEKVKEPLAWFSDKNGIPCITGKRITNAPSYLAQRIGLSTASSYARADAAAQITTNQSGDTTSSALTGDPKQFAKNTAISDGINEASDWLDERQSNSFDAIYIPPGTELAVHITKQLNIDYDPEGRKVNHYANIPRSSQYQLD